MSRFCLQIFLLLSSFFYSGPKYGVQKIWLFSKVQYFGNVPVNPNGNQLKGYQFTLTCYLKICKKLESPDWQTAYFNGNRYKVNILPITQDSVIVGTLKNTHSIIVIKDSSGTKLVQLILTKQTNIHNVIMVGFELEGTLNNNNVHLESNECVVELSPSIMP